MKKTITLLAAFAALNLGAQNITSVSPNFGSLGTWSLPITITGSGTNFSAATNTVVRIKHGTDELEILSINSITPQSVSVDIRIPYFAYYGDYDVQVYDQNVGLITLADGFTTVVPFAFPSIVATYPDSVIANSVLPVTISATNMLFSQATDNTIFLTQGSNTIFPIQGTIQAISNDSIQAMFDFNLPYLQVGDLLNSHCGNSFAGIYSDNQSIEIIDSTLSITKTYSDFQISTYPNPTSGPLSVNLPKDLINFQLTVYSQSGQLIYSQSVKNNTSHILKTDISSLADGIYLIKIQDRDRQYEVKIIKE